MQSDLTNIGNEESAQEENFIKLVNASNSGVNLESQSSEAPASSTSFSHLMQSMVLPSRVMASAFRTPFKIAMKGRRLPSWTTQMEVIVTSFRSACRNAPRDISLMRAWTDISVPDLILPKGAVVHSSKLHGLEVEWVFPHKLTPNHPRGKRRLSASHFSNEMVRQWSETHPIVLYLHGGAFALCGSNTHMNILSALALEDLVLFAPNYRRPPDVSIVEVVDDCYKAYRYLTDVVSIDPKRIAIAGDSAGGSLTILTMCRIREDKLPMPMCGVLLSPWCDLADPEIQEKADTGIIMPEHDYLPYDAIAMISKLVIGDLSPDDPRINPIHAKLDNLPNILIHAGAVEVLFNQILRFFEKLKEYGVDVRLKIWPDMVHVPHAFTAVSEIANMAVADVAKYISDQYILCNGFGIGVHESRRRGQNTVQ